MKCVILAGGIGSRLSEETINIPKPMVKIGDMPILWHIMQIYSHFKVNEFVICLGYKGELVKDYFYNYYLNNSDIEIDLGSNKIKFINKKIPNWKIHLIDTGKKTETAGRLSYTKKFFKKNENFFFTYGDGLSDIDIKKLYNHHLKNNKIATISLSNPEGRFGKVILDKNHLIKSFQEKKDGIDNYVNAGFAVFNYKIFDFINRKGDVLEKDIFPILVKKGELSSYIHKGFWKPMDTLRDKNILNDLWNKRNAKWKMW